MSLSEPIQQWLTKPTDYATGLALLKQTGTVTAFTLQILERGDDVYTRGRLIELLTSFTRQAPRPEPKPAPAAAPAPVVVVATETPPIDPALTAPLEQAAGKLMDERSELKARIRAKMDDETAAEDRREWALRIVGITQQLDDLYARIAFGRQHGYLPAGGNEPEVDDNPQLTLLNVRSYISRYRKRLTEAKTDEKRQSYAALLKHYEAERERLENQLKPK